MKTLNEEGIVFGLLPESEQARMKEAHGDWGCKLFLFSEGGWVEIESSSWTPHFVYKVELPTPPLKKLSDQPWENSWARFRAVDADSYAFEFEMRPTIGKGDEFNSPYGEVSTTLGKFDPTNWQDSLEERETERKAKDVPENLDGSSDVAMAINWILDQHRGNT